MGVESTMPACGSSADCGSVAVALDAADGLDEADGPEDGDADAVLDEVDVTEAVAGCDGLAVALAAGAADAVEVDGAIDGAAEDEDGAVTTSRTDGEVEL